MPKLITSAQKKSLSCLLLLSALLFAGVVDATHLHTDGSAELECSFLHLNSDEEASPDALQVFAVTGSSTTPNNVHAADLLKPGYDYFSARAPPTDS